MNIGIIDADLIGKRNHNFPNLACMKISGFHKKRGHSVDLISYADISQDSLFKKKYDKVFISKAFTDTTVPDGILGLPNVIHGGTGFFFDKAEYLPDEIEHHMPDYTLYDKWIKEKVKRGKNPAYFKYYTEYSMGYTTRGCIRGCEFCVNRNSKKVVKHSPVDEFMDNAKKKICLIDDNILAYQNWQDVIEKLNDTNKPFQYNQGLDIRLLTKQKAEMLISSKYDGDYIFAFDDYKDKALIIKKLSMFMELCGRIIPKLYVLTGFDSKNKYDYEFWHNDLLTTLERIKILFSLGAIPYIMKYDKLNIAKNNPFASILDFITNWANQTQYVKKMSLNDIYQDSKVKAIFTREYPEIVDKYFNMKLKRR